MPSDSRSSYLLHRVAWLAVAIAALAAPGAVVSAENETGNVTRADATVVPGPAAQSAQVAQSAAPEQPAHPLVWDSLAKTIEAEPGEGVADFSFTVTNASSQPVTIDQLRPTCGCTVAEMPSSPWVIAPGATESFAGTIDFRGKEGTVTKSIFVNSSAGTQRLELTVKIPTLTPEQRTENQRIAQKNRQAIFSGDCAKCHLEPAKGRSGAELFTAACGVCHFSPSRSTVVPDLLTARLPRDAAFWRKWITEGKEGTLMPAWSQTKGGPLSDEQIESLVKWALETLPTQPPESPRASGKP
jgi:mono/diheme cytochrome c family protein